MKKIYTVAGLLVLSFFIAIIYSRISQIRVEVTDISSDYSQNKTDADGKYLNKTVYVEGVVKAYYKVLGTRNVLELDTYNTGKNVFFFFTSEKDETNASRLQQGDKVTVKGKCLGTDAYNFLDGVKFEVTDITNKLR
jgi:tRNA(Ile2) C34 agmatinyltransferase TiaS